MSDQPVPQAKEAKKRKPAAQPQEPSIKVVSMPLSLISRPKTPDRASAGKTNIEELAASMAAEGLLQPIILVKSERGYEVVAGDRRLLAARHLEWESIDAIVREANPNDISVYRATENLQREALTPIEEALAVQRLRTERNMTQEEVAARLGKGVEWVKKAEALLRLPSLLQSALQHGDISKSVAIELGRIDDQDILKYYLNQAIMQGVTQAIAEVWVSNYLRDGSQAQPVNMEEAQQAVAEARKPPTTLCHCCKQEFPIQEMSTIFVCSDDAKAIEGATVPQPQPVGNV